MPRLYALTDTFIVNHQHRSRNRYNYVEI